MARSLSAGSAPNADLTLPASTLFSSTGGFAGSSDLGSSRGFAAAISIFPSAGDCCACAGGSLFHRDWIWSHPPRLNTAATAVTAVRARRPLLFDFMTRSMGNWTTPLRQGCHSDSFSESAECTSAVSSSPPPDGLQARATLALPQRPDDRHDD